MAKKKILKKSLSISERYSESLKFLKSCKREITYSIILFLVFIVVGFLFPQIFEEEIKKFLSELIKQVEGKNFIELFLFIFLNNLKAGFFSVLFGIGFGIFPIIIALTNGYVLGFVFNMAIASEGVLSLWRILPHGIFELPAFLISVGFGIKIGISAIKRKNFKNNVIQSLWAFLLIIIPLLLIAGLIETSLIILFK